MEFSILFIACRPPAAQVENRWSKWFQRLPKLIKSKDLCSTVIIACVRRHCIQMSISTLKDQPFASVAGN